MNMKVSPSKKDSVLMYGFAASKAKKNLIIF